MMKLCLMASHGYPPGPGLALRQEQGIGRVIKDCQPYVPRNAVRQEMMRSGSLNLRPNQLEEPWKFTSELSNSDQLVSIDSAIRKPVLIDLQDTRLDSVFFSLGIAENCTRREKILQLLMSGSSEAEEGVLNLSLLSDLMGPQMLTFNLHRQPVASSLVYPNTEFSSQKPLVDFMGDMALNSKITYHPDGRVLFTGNKSEMKDFLSVVAEFYLPKNSTRWRKQSMLVPYFSWMDSVEALATINGSSVKLEAATVAPLKSTEKTNLKQLRKKKNSKKGAKERDIYKRNYFHACECLLSLMVNKRRHHKTAILSLKKSGPELPDLLAQFSTGIAGTGLAVLFSVICKLACGRVTLCSSKLFNTGMGFGLVWLSWAVNKLRDTVIHISKNASKTGLKDEDMMKQVDKSVKEIYFRAAALMAVAVVRLA